MRLRFGRVDGDSWRLGIVWSFRHDSPELAVTVQSRLRVTATEGVRAAVPADVGPTIASERLFSPELRSGTVRAVLLQWSPLALDLLGGVCDRARRDGQGTRVCGVLRSYVQRMTYGRLV
jgi:hypothetical protein